MCDGNTVINYCVTIATKILLVYPKLKPSLKNINEFVVNANGQHFIPFDQNICRSKQDMKNGKRVLYILLKALLN